MEAGQGPVSGPTAAAASLYEAMTPQANKLSLEKTASFSVAHGDHGE